MRIPVEAAHVLGKLSKYVGEDNVLWGTDCLFYGSPQDQIQAIQSFRISEEFQQRYGYSELTRAIKNKMLGGNGARLYGVEPITDRCAVTRRELEQIRRQLPGRNLTLGPSTVAEAQAFRELDRAAIAQDVLSPQAGGDGGGVLLALSPEHLLVIRDDLALATASRAIERRDFLLMSWTTPRP